MAVWGKVQQVAWGRPVIRFAGLLCCCLESAASGPMQRFCMPEDNMLKDKGGMGLLRGCLFV